jgi:hypothetical protein
VREVEHLKQIVFLDAEGNESRLQQAIQKVHDLQATLQVKLTELNKTLDSPFINRISKNAMQLR